MWLPAEDSMAGLLPAHPWRKGKRKKARVPLWGKCQCGSLRDEILHDVADGLLEHHDDSHLDEEVGDAAARVALEGTTRQG